MAYTSQLSSNEAVFAGTGYGYGIPSEVLQKRIQEKKSTLKKRGETVEEIQSRGKELLKDELLLFNSIVNKDCTMEDYTEHYERVKATDKLRRYKIFNNIKSGAVYDEDEGFEQVQKSRGRKAKNDIISIEFNRIIDLLISNLKIEDPEEELKSLIYKDFSDNYLDSSSSNNMNPQLIAVTMMWFYTHFDGKGLETITSNDIIENSKSKATKEFLNIVNKFFTVKQDNDSLLFNMLIYANWML